MGFSQVQKDLFSFFSVIKVASLETALKILEESLSAVGLDTSSVNEKKLIEEITQINTIIPKYNLEIVDLTDEITCKKLFILIDTGNNISQKSLFYNENTTHFFSKIVKECVLSEEGSLSETHCLNLNSQAGITKSEAQIILRKLIKDKWLNHADDKISLGVRSIAELGASIKQHYPNDIKNCPFCKLMVFQGYVCHNCKIKTHYACWKKYFKLSKKNCVCPSCKKLWTEVPSHIEIEDFCQEERDADFTRAEVHHPKKKKKLGTSV